MVKPNFFIIGAQKSASTFVQQVLAEHPEVLLLPGEVPFFETHAYDRAKIKDFEKLFDNVTTERAIGLKRPNYLANPEVPERIYKHYPNAKLILVIRNPIERAVSAYYHYMALKYIPMADIETGMTKIINNEYKSTYPKAHEIIDFGFYHKYLMNYLRFFEMSQVHIILYDEIKKSPLEEIKKICNFLEINSNYVPQSLYQKPQAVVYSLPNLRLLRIRRDLEKKYLRHIYNEDSTLKSIEVNNIFWVALIKLITLYVKIIKIITLHVKFTNKVLGNEKPKLTANLKSNLVSIYEKDINSLSQLLGINLEDWKK